jgi:hypothetical protein
VHKSGSCKLATAGIKRKRIRRTGTHSAQYSVFFSSGVIQLFIYAGRDSGFCDRFMTHKHANINIRLHSQEGQDSCAAAAAEHLIFKTSTEDQTVHLTNKGMRKDSERFSPWLGAGGCMKVQTSDDMCEGACKASSEGV